MQLKLYRRTFTKLGVLTGASVFVLPACDDTPTTGDAAVALTKEERRLFERFAEAYLPTEGTALKPLAEVPVVDNIEHALSLLDAPTLEQVRLGIKIFDYGAIVIGLHFARFVHLAAEQRVAYIERWARGAEIQRGISTMLKKLVCFGYWKNIEAARAIGYAGPVSDASGLKPLGNAPVPETKG